MAVSKAPKIVQRSKRVAFMNTAAPEGPGKIRKNEKIYNHNK